MTDEQRKRIHDITYSTDDREELAERIVRLEDERDLYSSLVEDMDHPDTANQLRAENARLQDENARLRSCLSDDAENARQIMGESARLREQVTQLQDDWESERDYADQMEATEKRAVAENTKLRELVHKYGEYTSQDRCEGCVCKARCNDGDVDECWQLKEIREMARELGI